MRALGKQGVDEHGFLPLGEGNTLDDGASKILWSQTFCTLSIMMQCLKCQQDFVINSAILFARENMK